MNIIIFFGNYLFKGDDKMENNYNIENMIEYNFNNKKHLSIVKVSLLTALFFTSLLIITKSYNSVFMYDEKEIVRLHVIADSDEKYDQNKKLEIYSIIMKILNEKIENVDVHNQDRKMARKNYIDELKILR